MKSIHKLLGLTIFLFYFQVGFSQPFVDYFAGVGIRYIQPDYANLNYESLGIGDFNTALTIPQAAIHVNTNYFAFPPTYAAGEVFRTDNPGTDHAYWRMYKGNVNYGNIYNRSGDSHFHFEAPRGNVIFDASGVAAGALSIQRMRIANGFGGDGVGNYGTIANGTKIAISRGAAATTMFFPVANFNIGSDVSGSPSDGRRDWMEVGTYYAYETDHMYTGILDMGSDEKDAVINFGADPDVNTGGVQNLRFIFTEGPEQPLNFDPYDGRSTQGVEIARMTAGGNMGIGAVFSSSQQPVRRLEIVDNGINQYNHKAGPQLRLTNTLATLGSPTSTGIWTDFETTTAGHLVINPSHTGVNKNVGINTNPTPQNTLEINNNIISPTTPATGGSTGASGLRFQKLTSSSTPLTTHPFATGNHAVLSVDASGDVVLVRDDGGTVTSTCGTSNYVPLMSSSTNIACSQIFDDATTVGIGVGTGVDNAFKLQMEGDFLIEHSSSTTTGDIYMNDGLLSTNRRVFAMHGTGGYFALSLGPGAGGPGIANASLSGVYIGRDAGNIVDNDDHNTFVGSASGLVYNGNTGEGENTFIGASAGIAQTTGERNIYVGTQAGYNLTSGNRNTFIGHESGGSGLTSGDDNIILGTGYFNGITTATNNILIGNGAHALASLTSFTNSVSIGHNNRVECENCVTMAAQTDQTEQQVGIGYFNPSVVTTSPLPAGAEAKLYVEDYGTGGTSAFFNGRVYAVGAYTASDAFLKDNIAPFTDATSIINQIEAKTYDFKHQDYPSLTLPTGNQIGFMADDIEAVAPQLVQWFSNPALRDSSGVEIEPQIDFKAVNYTGLIPILFTAIKQQMARIDALEATVAICCAAPIVNPNPENRASIQLTNKSTIILNQNSPNPFREKTDITYSIPESVKTALILFYDQSGRVINTHEINHKGDGTLTVYGENLEAGIYSYTLIIDGEAFKTKKMVKE